MKEATEALKKVYEDTEKIKHATQAACYYNLVRRAANSPDGELRELAAECDTLFKKALKKEDKAFEAWLAALVREAK